MKKLSLHGWRARPKNNIAVYPSVYTMAYATSLDCLKAYGAKLKSIIYIIGQDDMEILTESKADYYKFSSLLTNKFKKQPKYLDELIKWSESKINLLYDFINKNFNENTIKQLSNKEIASRCLKYTKIYLAYHFKNTPAWWMGALEAEKELKNYLIFNHPDRNIDDLLSTIISPLEYPSENFQEELSLLNMAIKLKKMECHNLRSIKNLPQNIKNDLHKHFSTYNSLSFGYNTGLVRQEDYFFKRLNQMVKKNPINSKTDKLKEIEIKKTKRDVLTAGLHLPRDTKNLVFALRKLAYLQELKKTTQTRSHPLLQLVVKKEIARRLKIEVKYLDYLSEIEIGRLLKLNHITPKFKKELKQRGSSAVLIIRNMKSTWLIGEKAKDFIKNNGLTLNIKGIKEITGQAASKGLVRGHVKICLFSQEINKIKKGDILVTNMTTPDFVPGMRLAAAIITDEGGITSHAAIVARELNKPCIIGTKIASKVFHDGDLVEVDANKGTIKKLS
jgi:phosphoenolpyruvate synthase/pyruvate phosphate dikinase